jgi:SAM-dependent methyltransferase
MDSFLSGVNTTIHPKDEMLLSAVQSLQSYDLAWSLYFHQGAEIHDTIMQIANWRFGDLASVPKFLDFACGYGRSTRFLVRNLKPSKIWVSDIYKEAVEFQKRTFDVSGFVSVTDPSTLVSETGFDMIFVASLFTHLPESRFEAWFKRLFSMLSPNGILAFSVHDEALAAGRSIPSSGIFFSPESESQSLSKAEYGTNVVTEGYVSGVIKRVAGSTWKYHRGRKVMCGVHDVYLVSRDQEEGFSDFEYSLLPVGYVDWFLREADGTIRIGGWAGEPNEHVDLDEVRVYIDGQLLAASKTGLPRPDVVNVLGQPKFAKSGWEVCLSKSKIPKSSGMIEVRAFSQTGTSTMLHFSPLSAAQETKEAVTERSLPSAARIRSWVRKIFQSLFE